MGVDFVDRDAGWYVPQWFAEESRHVNADAVHLVKDLSYDEPSSSRLLNHNLDMLTEGIGSFDKLSTPASIPTTLTTSTTSEPVAEPVRNLVAKDYTQQPPSSITWTEVAGMTGLDDKSEGVLVGGPPKAPREPTPKDWGVLRPIVNVLYTKLTLAQVIEVLRSKHGFKTR